MSVRSTGLPARLSAALAVALVMAAAPQGVLAEPALQVLGRDIELPNRVDGLPTRLSEFPGLQIRHFTTNDGVKLAYWEAGGQSAAQARGAERRPSDGHGATSPDHDTRTGPRQGANDRPLIFVPGWSANGAQYFNVLYLMARHRHVYVLDPRNQGLSQHVDHGTRIARLAMDLRQFGEHIGATSADYVGHSMGAAILWSYIDLFGTAGIRKVAFVDEPVSIYAHSDWTEQERSEAGGTTTSPERMVAALTAGGPVNSLVTDMKPFQRAAMMDSPSYANSEAFARAVIRNDPQAMGRVLFDHTMNDWRDVVRRKIDVPSAFFSGAQSNNLSSMRWAASVNPKAVLHEYSSDDQGDHFLMFKNPVKFTNDLEAFLKD